MICWIQTIFYTFIFDFDIIHEGQWLFCFFVLSKKIFYSYTEFRTVFNVVWNMLYFNYVICANTCTYRTQQVLYILHVLFHLEWHVEDQSLINLDAV